jgi:hypothetical protein
MNSAKGRSARGTLSTLVNGGKRRERAIRRKDIVHSLLVDMRDRLGDKPD